MMKLNGTGVKEATTEHECNQYTKPKYASATELGN